MRDLLRRLARRVVGRALRPVHPDRAVIAKHFDYAYYLKVNPDIARARVDPLDHFLEHGWREGRDPNSRFSVREYLANNSDVAQAGVNPFVHYIQAGRFEGRVASHDLGFRYGILARMPLLKDDVAAAIKATAAARPGSPASLAKKLAAARTGLKDLHITFSHDDYRVNVGGVQLCIQQEDAEIARLGRDHLNFHPVAYWPVLSAGPGEARLGVALNGEKLGTYTPTVIAAALAEHPPAGGERSFAIHSLLGHAVEDVVEILRAAKLKAGFFWLHDYASLCAGFNLLRNGVEDCAAPPPDSGACEICVFGPWRGRHVAGHEALFRALNITVVSPAPSTLAFWESAWRGPAASAVVHPHARMEPRGPAPLTADARPLRVAFTGYPVDHKGWPLFRSIVEFHNEDPRYEFFHLGAKRGPDLPLAFHDVRVSAERPRAMQAALEALEIDVVLFWPLWRETFSFAVYEAVAAGCAVVTGPDSGNVAAVVRDTGAGWVLPDAPALAASFASGDIAALARARRKPMLYDLTLSGMTADLLPQRARA